MMDKLRDLTAEQRRLDVILQETYGTPLRTAAVPRTKPRRPCDRCGIPTRRPDRCIDCLGQP